MNPRKILALFAAAFVALALLVSGVQLALAAPDAGPVAAEAIGTSPSSPAVTEPSPADAWAAFSAGQHALGVALALMAALVLLRRVAPALFETDLLGTLTAFVGSFLGGLATALSTGAPLGWGMVKASFVVAVLAVGGYSVLWRKILKPALRWLADNAEWHWASKVLK